MEFVLTGFRQEANIRKYGFHGVGAGQKRAGPPTAAPRSGSRVITGARPASPASGDFTVDVDLGLIQKYQIPMQELPLLCRRFLMAHADGALTRTLIYTEEEMLGYANRRAAARDAAESKRKPHRRPVSNKIGQAWRTQAGPRPGGGNAR